MEARMPPELVVLVEPLWCIFADDSSLLRSFENDTSWYVTSSLQCFSFKDPGKKTSEWSLLLLTLGGSSHSPLSLWRQQASLVSKHYAFYETGVGKQQTQEWASRSQHRNTNTLVSLNQNQPPKAISWEGKESRTLKNHMGHAGPSNLIQ